MTVEIRVSTNLDAWKREIEARRKSIPGLLAKALNNVAFDAREAVQKDIDTRLTARPWIRRGVLVEKASVSQLRASVYVADRQAKYLLENVTGGSRGWKAFEMRLRTTGILPAGMYCVPGDGLDLDQYGSPLRAALVRILRSLTVVASSAPTRRTRKPRTTYFAIREPQNGLRPGIYAKFSSGAVPKCMVIFTTRRPTYRARLPFYETVQRTVETRWAAAVDQALAWGRP